MGRDSLTSMKSCMDYMIVLMMLIGSAWSRILDNSTQDVDHRRSCYPSCHSWETCCPSGDCVDSPEDCEGCSTEADCGSYEVCCAGECINYDYSCDEKTCSVNNPCAFDWQLCCGGVCVEGGFGCHLTTTSTSTASPSCDDDPTICNDLGFDYPVCCDKGDGWECMDLDDCMGISEDALWGIGMAAAVSVIAVPILCCCCCGGCALYFILKSRKKRQGQVHQPGVHMMQPQQPGMQMMQGGQVQPQGYPAGGFAAPQPGYEHVGQSGGLYPSVQNPKNVNQSE